MNEDTIEEAEETPSRRARLRARLQQVVAWRPDFGVRRFCAKLRNPDFVIDFLTVVAAVSGLAVFALLTAVVIAGCLALVSVMDFPVVTAALIGFAAFTIVVAAFSALALTTSMALARRKNQPSVHMNDLL